MIDDDKKLIGACGIFCADCGIYKSYKSQDKERQERCMHMRAWSS